SRTAWKCHRNARPETQARAMLGSQRERQEWFVCGFEGPDTIESRVVGKPFQRRHLFQLVYEQARVKLHRLLYSLLDSIPLATRIRVHKRASHVEVSTLR